MASLIDSLLEWANKSAGTLSDGAGMMYDTASGALPSPGEAINDTFYGINQAMGGVAPGVSADEADKASTKLAELMARNEKKRADNTERAQSLREMKLRMDSGAAPEDQFTAVGDDVRQGSANKLSFTKFNQGKGSFTKLNKPDHDYSDSGGALSSGDLVEKNGINPAAAELIAKLSNAKTPQSAQAIQLALQATPDRQTPQQQDIEVLRSLMGSKDPISAKPIAVSILRRLGRKDDYIAELFKQMAKDS